MADAQDLVEALMADAQDVPDDMTLGDLARRLRERALERLGHDADVRLPVLHVLLAAVVGERPPNASELVACLAALPSDRQSTVEEGQHALRGVLRIFAACTAGGQSLLIDDAGVLTFVAVVQAFVFSDAISFEALLAWHEDRALDRELEARGLSAHDPRQSAPWRSVLGWARAAIARLESDQEKGGVCGAATAEAQSPELVACAKTSTWRPSDARIALYVELGGGAGETIVVVDGLVDEGLRAGEWCSAARAASPCVSPRIAQAPHAAAVPSLINARAFAQRCSTLRPRLAGTTLEGRPARAGRAAHQMAMACRARGASSQSACAS